MAETPRSCVGVSVWRTDDSAHCAVLIFLKRLLNLGVCVHYKRTATDYRLGDRFSIHDQQAGISLCFNGDAISSPGEDCQVAGSHFAPTIHRDIAGQDEENARVAIG